MFQGCFGQFNRQKRLEPGSRPPRPRSYNPETDVFPPPDDVQPVATLNLYEAYFLAFIAPCLEIWDGATGNMLKVEELMVIFTAMRPLFPYMFAAFYHFRMLNYVVASGIKFGTDLGVDARFLVVERGEIA